MTAFLNKKVREFAMKKGKKIIEIIVKTIFSVFLLLILGSQLFPAQFSAIFKLKTYVILTDSMEPNIPTYSLVVNKALDKDDKIKKDSIVTFKIERNKEDTYLTHYYRETKKANDGKTYYRTQPQGVKDQYDPYYTKRSDIVGTYLFHIPFIGKTILFLQSKFAWIYYCILLVIFLINLTLRSKWKEEDEASKESMLHASPNIEGAS